VNNRYIFEEAYRNALTSHGIPFDPDLIVRVPNTEAGGYQLGQDLLAIQDRPTAVILVQETLAIGLYRSLGEASLEPGRDLSVIGFRQNPTCRFLSPSLTCFSLSLQELGVRLGEVLMNVMHRGPSEADPEPVRQLWPMTLVPGQSDQLTGSSLPKSRSRPRS
jgi:DNA-binding LacI/PurR family transcriptional regulator